MYICHIIFKAISWRKKEVYLFRNKMQYSADNKFVIRICKDFKRNFTLAIYQSVDMSLKLFNYKGKQISQSPWTILYIGYFLNTWVQIYIHFFSYYKEKVCFLWTLLIIQATFDHWPFDSEQQLVDCYCDTGCAGGSFQDSWSYVAI